MIGGSCPDIACLPSKNIIHGAKVASLVRRAAEFGISTGPVTLDMPGVFARKRQMVDELIAIHQQRYRESGAELIMGEARFIDLNMVQVTAQGGSVRVMRGERVFVNVGSHAKIPAIPGLAAARPMTHVEALNLTRLPEHLVILGGGFVGVEFAQAMRRFGSKVTIIQRDEQLLSSEDADVSTGMQQVLEREGVTIHLKSELGRVDGTSGNHLRLLVRQGAERLDMEATDMLVAAGRVPNTAGLGADSAGIALDEAGYIRVNDRLETTAPGTWAMGECAGSPLFTHAAFDDFRVVHANLSGGSRVTTGRLIPYCVFTDPELARIGLSEREAKKRGIPYRLARLPMKAVLRTRTLSEPEGFIKALVGTDDRIVGFAGLGVEASELLAAIQTAMLGKLPYQVLKDAVFAHPTVAEGFWALFMSLPKGA
jgi:pyruvate/2-oxoglutarate dehydrogenase complex dihydrolipoamide dehydrogenase (E3) component